MGLIFTLPMLGPWLLRLAPVVARLPTFATVKRWLRVASYLVVMAAGAWLGGSVLTWWRGDMISQRLANEQAKEKCVSTIAKATLEQRERAVADREAALTRRENALAADAKAVAEYEAQLEVERAKSSSDGAAVIGGDDEWLRNWAKRK